MQALVCCKDYANQDKVHSHFCSDMYSHTQVEREQGCSPISALSHCVMAYRGVGSCFCVGGALVWHSLQMTSFVHRWWASVNVETQVDLYWEVRWRLEGLLSPILPASTLVKAYQALCPENMGGHQPLQPPPFLHHGLTTLTWAIYIICLEISWLTVQNVMVYLLIRAHSSQSVMWMSINWQNLN